MKLRENYREEGFVPADCQGALWTRGGKISGSFLHCVCGACVLKYWVVALSLCKAACAGFV